jgi:hypothetical protein
MAGVISNFVPKRAKQAGYALLCLLAIQALLVLTNCQAEPAAMAARVTVSH